MDNDHAASASTCRHLGDLKPSICLEVVTLHGSDGLGRLATWKKSKRDLNFKKNEHIVSIYRKVFCSNAIIFAILK